MVKTTYFVQECPTCGRGLEIRVEYFGRSMVCQHCGGSFVATQGASGGQESATASVLTDSMRRAEELLNRAGQLRAQARAG